jgi:PAS domain S-box-containing protein
MGGRRVRGARTPDGARVARRTVRGALILIAALIVALVVAGALSTHQIYTDANHRLIDEAAPVFASSEDVLVEMLNEETGVRGYVSSGDPATLAPYRQGRRYEALELQLLKKDQSVDPAIPKHLAQVRQQVAELNRFYDQQIALVRSGPAGRRQAQANVLEGKAHFDRFRQAALALDQDASRVIKTGQHRQHHTFVQVLVFLIAAGAIALAITGWLLFRVPARLYRLYRGEQEARRAAEQGADASRALAYVGDAVVLLDEDDRIRHWNPAAEELFGVSRAEAVGYRAAEVVPALGELAEQATGEHSLTIQGRVRWVAAAETTFQGGRVLVLRDVTEDHELERVRSDFVATAAHELRTPLAAVYGAVRTIRRDDVQLSDEIKEELLEILESESEQLGLIVDQLLVSAQLDRNQVRLKLGTVDAAGLCKEILDSAGVRMPDGLEVVYRPPHGPLLVKADRDRLRQVLANLIDNAIKYSPAGGTIEVRLSRMNSSGVIEVADEGIGIPPEGRERIFEKFYRLDPNMTGGVGGSGLGLYISRELVRSMHGSLTVESALGSGSTFRVVLPQAGAA